MRVGDSIPPTSIYINHYYSVTYKRTGVLYPRPLMSHNELSVTYEGDGHDLVTVTSKSLCHNANRGVRFLHLQYYGPII